MHGRGNRVLLRTIALIVCILIPMGCGGGGDDGNDPANCAAPAYTGLDGLWDMTYTPLTENCGDGLGAVEYDTVSVTQNGSTIVVDGSTTMLLCGTQMTIPSNSYPDDGGTTTEHPTTVTFTSATYFSGVTSWTWTGPGGSCNGTFRIEGSKQ